MHKLKLLHVLNEINYSGAEIMLFRSARFFLGKDYELYALNSTKEMGPYVETLKQSGFNIIHLPFALSFSNFWKVYTLLKTHKFNVVHNHTERTFFWYAIACKILGIKYIRTIHSTFQFSWPVRLKRMVYRHAARFFFNTEFVSISRNVQENEQKQFLLSSLLIPNWADPDIFSPATNKEKQLIRKSMNIPLNKFIIISVGSCSAVKNHIDIIKAMTIVQLNHCNILYLNVGDGPLRDFLEAQAKELGLLRQVFFLGRRKNIKELLLASDLFVMTSKYEGLSISTLEALSCGLPVIVYDKKGLRDLVIDGKNGFIVDENYEKLAEKIIHLYENPKLAKQMGKESTKFVRENFDMCTSLLLLRNLYESNGQKTTKDVLPKQVPQIHKEMALAHDVH